MKLFGGSGHNSQNKKNRGTPPKNRGEVERTNINNEEPKKKGKAVKVILIILAVLVLIAGGVFAYWKISTRPPETPPSTESAVPIKATQQYYSLLVVGDDQEGGNTDTIMLVRFDTVNMKVNVLSIPRDTLVNSSLGNKKINAVYHNLDGITSLMDAVEDIAGFRPNNYVVVDTNVFVKVVDAMGGVEFDVPFDMDYDDYADKDKDGICEYVFTIHLKEGQQKLSGYDALGVFRWRQNNNGSGHVYSNPDIERINTQHNLLMAIAGKAMSTKNVVTLTNIASAVLDKCVTDLTIGNIQWYIEQFLQMSMENIEFFTMPTTGAWINKVAYVTINTDEWMDMVNANFNPYETEIKKENCSILYLAKPKELVNGQLYINSDDLDITDGSEINTNFIKGK
ncbi:MAG: LCP family protein [Oscillospiraceae bacterium]